MIKILSNLAVFTLVLFQWDYVENVDAPHEGFKLYIQNSDGSGDVQVVESADRDIRELQADVDVTVAKKVYAVSYNTWAESDPSNEIFIGGKPDSPTALNAAPAE